MILLPGTAAYPDDPYLAEFVFVSCGSPKGVRERVLDAAAASELFAALSRNPWLPSTLFFLLFVHRYV